MQIVLIGYLAFVLASLVVGTRLLHLAWRRRGLAEAALGVGFFCSGGVGFLLLVTPLLLPGLGEEALARVRMAGQVVTNAGFLGLYFFNVRVFGGGRPLATLAAVAGCGLLGLALASAALHGVETLLRVGSFGYVCTFAGRTGAFLWAAASGLHHHSLQRRRLTLGLAEPEVVNRFLLWGLYGVFTTALMLSGLAGSLLAGADGRPPLATSLALSGFGLACATCMWLAFFPPQGYLRRLRAGIGR